MHLGLHDIDGARAAVAEVAETLEVVQCHQAGDDGVENALRRFRSIRQQDGGRGHQVADIAYEEQGAARQGQLAEAAVRIALGCDRVAALQDVLGHAGLLRQRVRHVDAREVPGDRGQVIVGEGLQQAGHQAVVPASLPEMQQLVVQVTRGLAGDARVIAVRAGAALATVARRAGERALRHGVFELDGCCARRGGTAQQDQANKGAAHGTGLCHFTERAHGGVGTQRTWAWRASYSFPAVALLMWAA